MDIVVIHKGQINTEALDASLRAQLASGFLGLSVAGERIVLHLADDSPAAAVDRARQVVSSHDPGQLTPRQQALLQRQQRLQQARDQKGMVLNPADFANNLLLLTLARKIAWLEQEINDLRDEG